MPRIQPVERPYGPEIAARLTMMMPPGAEPIGLFRAFVKNLPMTRAMSGWGSYELSRALSLSMREREILIDRTCALAGCEYEWGVHVAFYAERVGFGMSQLRSLASGGPADPCWTEDRERRLIRAADALYADGDLEDELWCDLLEVCTEAEVLDVLMLCGWYRVISLVARVIRLDNEPGLPTFADFAMSSLRA
jgi:alkylhydroperoxidase family enzyme